MMDFLDKCCMLIYSICAFLLLNSKADLSSARVFPAVLGSSVTLDCSIQQTDVLIWDRSSDGTVIAIKGDLHQGNNASSKFFLQTTSTGQALIIHSLDLADDGTYRCYDLHDMGHKELFNVTILVEPSYVEATGPTGVIEEGQSQMFTCTADGGKPPPTIEWALIDRKANKTSYAGISDDRRYNNGTYRRINRLLLPVSRAMYLASMICTASISYFFKVQHTIVLDVNLYPLPPQFSSFTGLFDDGRMHNIECHSGGSRPVATITWELNGNKVAATSDSTTQGADGLFYVSSILTRRLTKDMEGQVLSCLVTNQVLSNQNRRDLATRVTLLANYAPSIVADNGTWTVSEDQDVTVRCGIDARPLPEGSAFAWFHNGKMLTESSTYNISKNVLSVSRMESALRISPVTRDSYGQYYCQASNHLGTARGEVLTLDVRYRPVCAFSTKQKHAVVLGSSITLSCPVNANPSNVTMTWRYVTRAVSPIREKLTGLRMVDGSLYTTVTIPISSDNQYTDVECIASNTLGETKNPCFYGIVKPGPPDVPYNCSFSTLSDTEVEVYCTPGFDGGYVQYFILQHLDDGQFHPVDNGTNPRFAVRDLAPGSNNTYRLCSATDAYPTIMSCSLTITATTTNSNTGVEQKRMQDVESANITPYIIGGIGGFIALVLIITLAVYCSRRRQQTSRRRWNTGEKLQAADTNTRLEALKAADRSARTEAAANHTSSSIVTNQDAETGQKRQDSNNAHADMNHETNSKRENKKLIDLVENGGKPSSEPSKQENDDVKEGDNLHINLAFIGDEVTDLDELSHPRSPFNNRLAGSPRHEFCYSETDIAKASTGQRCDDVSDVGQSLRRSKSHESVTDAKTTPGSTLDKKHDYINLAYDDSSSERYNPNNNDQIDPNLGNYADNFLKRAFVSQYSIQSRQSTESKTDLAAEDGEKGSQSVVSDDWNTIPRRQSYNMAVGNAAHGRTRSGGEKLYDIPRISSMEGDDARNSEDHELRNSSDIYLRGHSESTTNNIEVIVGDEIFKKPKISRDDETTIHVPEVGVIAVELKPDSNGVPEHITAYF